jgi:hypothetical protein
VQWRLTVPVLQALIEDEVKRGSRAFVVCGLRVGDVEGVRAFGRTVSENISRRASSTNEWCTDRNGFKQIAEPAGIFAFLPATAPLDTQVWPPEYSSRTVWVSVIVCIHPPGSGTNDSVLLSRSLLRLSRRPTTLYSRYCTPSSSHQTKLQVSDKAGGCCSSSSSSSKTDDEEERNKGHRREASS